MSEIGWFGFVVFAEFAESMFFSSMVASSAAKDAETWNATDVVGNTCSAQCCRFGHHFVHGMIVADDASAEIGSCRGDRNTD